MQEVTVECYSGTEYAERPVRLDWQGRRLEIAQILQRGRQPEGKHFRVRTEDGRVFDLFYSEAEDEWRVQLI